jgi:hypothetical protein
MPNAIVEAIRSGDMDAVRAAVEDDPQAARHPSSILAAANQESLGALRLLHKNGADVNACWCH